jgi:MoxR-like ATPase
MNTQKLVQALEDAGYAPQSYSGRCMFGRKCVGVTVSRDVSAFRLAAEVAVALLDGDVDEGPNDVEDLARLRVSEDSMGLGSIIYFPGVEWKDSGEEENEEEVG